MLRGRDLTWPIGGFVKESRETDELRTLGDENATKLG
jgi:hypothetical protein